MITPGNPTRPRYGPSSFLAALGTLAGVQCVTWVWIPFWPLSIVAFLGASAAVLALGVFFGRSDDELGQVGRGMVIGWSAAPLTAALVAVSAIGYTLLFRG